MDFADYVNFANQWAKPIHTPEWCRLLHAIVRVDTLRDTTRVVVRDTLRDTIYVDREVVKRDTIYQTEIEYVDRLYLPPGIVNMSDGYGAIVGCGHSGVEEEVIAIDGVAVILANPAFTSEECDRRWREANPPICERDWFINLIEKLRNGNEATVQDLSQLIGAGAITHSQLQDLLESGLTWKEWGQRIQALVCE